MKNTIIILFTCCWLSLFSCKQINSDVRIIKLQEDTIISQLSDSSFFADVRSLFFHDKIYLTDYSRDQIIILDKDGNFIKTLGGKGKGPGEFLGASHLFKNNDTLYIANDAKRCIEVFTDSGYIRSLAFPQTVSLRANSRFFVHGSDFALTSFSDDNSNVFFDMVSGKTKNWGRLIKFTTGKQTRIRNHRHLFKYKSFILSVSNNMPIIEKYDLSGRILDVYDYSRVPVIQQTINHVENEKMGENTYFKMVPDAYLDNEKLYLLITSRKNDRVSSNHILEITVNDKMKITAIYILGNGWYNSICISKNQLWTFNVLNGNLSKYTLNEKK